MSGPLNVSAFVLLAVASADCAPGPPDGVGIPAGYGAEACRAATLRNGFTIAYRRHEPAGQLVRLWLCAGDGAGYIEIPGEQIEDFGQGQDAAPPAPSAPSGAKGAAGGPPVPPEDPIRNLIAAAAARYGIDSDFVASLANAESGLKPAAVSPKGAAGLMQLMPRTAASLGVGNALDPADNVEGGTRYLRQLLDQYGGDPAKALAAYNAGPQRVKQYGGIPPYSETRAYVARVIGDYNRRKTAGSSKGAPVPSRRAPERARPTHPTSAEAAETPGRPAASSASAAGTSAATGR
jgi:hypothetical protein